MSSLPVAASSSAETARGRLLAASRPLSAAAELCDLRRNPDRDHTHKPESHSLRRAKFLVDVWPFSYRRRQALRLRTRAHALHCDSNGTTHRTEMQHTMYTV